MDKKLYEVYVVMDKVNYFEKKLKRLKNKVEVININYVYSQNNELLAYYILEAEEGVIKPEFELAMN